ncbi:hypothetical protein hrd7_03840 [Leptolinea sp. HRD-7]|nr:hypothetical protein hrd7_03840 [Leptolinea sp. HRD-7]
MTVINELACSRSRRDEVLNQELARRLAAGKDTAGIKELIDHLQDKNADIANDSIKTIYEIGMIDPALIESYAEDFVRLLTSRNNRMVWGAMITLSTIASRQADRLMAHLDLIMKTTKNGSVITTDNGIKILGLIGSVRSDYREAVTPFLLEHLRTCRPKEVPQHAESALPAISKDNRDAFIAVINARVTDLTPGGLNRIKKVLKKAGSV